MGEAVHEEGDGLGVPAHVEDDFGAGVGEGEGEGHGALFADGGVFDDLRTRVSLFYSSSLSLSLSFSLSLDVG